MYPSNVSNYSGITVNSNKNTANNDAKKKKTTPVSSQANNTVNKHLSLIYNNSFLGGELKYFLITLHNGQILFF